MQINAETHIVNGVDANIGKPFAMSLPRQTIETAGNAGIKNHLRGLSGIPVNFVTHTKLTTHDNVLPASIPAI